MPTRRMKISEEARRLIATGGMTPRQAEAVEAIAGLATGEGPILDRSSRLRACAESLAAAG